MGRALFYYEWHSRWNRLCARLRRLRQPKYLFGAVAGGLYFYFYIFGAWFRGSAPGAAASMLAPEHRFLLASAGALVLSVVLLLMWVIPHERAALMFSEAEVAFLFPAPVARRTLLHFKLLKSQGAILFSALFMLVSGAGVVEIICSITSAGGGCFPSSTCTCSAVPLPGRCSSSAAFPTGVGGSLSWAASLWPPPASSFGRARPCRRRPIFPAIGVFPS